MNGHHNACGGRFQRAYHHHTALWRQKEHTIMLCDICGFNATFYGQTVKLVDDLNICRGCYLELNDLTYDILDARPYERRQIFQEFAA
jgi:hypothetical protein